MPSLIARRWRGATSAADADTYLRYMEQTGVAAFARTPGNRGSLTLRRIDGGRAEFVMISFWESMEAVKAFRGERAGAGGVLPGGRPRSDRAGSGRCAL